MENNNKNTTTRPGRFIAAKVDNKPNQPLTSGWYFVKYMRAKSTETRMGMGHYHRATNDWQVWNRWGSERTTAEVVAFSPVNLR